MVAITPTAERSSPAIQGWVIVARLITLMIFLQPFFIGLLFSGHSMGMYAHRANAYALFLLTLGGLIVATVTRRGTPAGRTMIGEFIHLLVGIIVVAILGVLSHEGVIRLHWLHFPAGVALLAPAMSLVAAAQGLYRPDADD